VSSFRRIPPGEEFPVSATLFVTYLRCPQQALARLQGVYPRTTEAGFRGSLAHRVFARHLVDGPISAEEFSNVCRQETGAHLGAAMASLALKPSEFRKITTDVEQLYDRFKSIALEDFEAAEVEVKSDPAEGVSLTGRVDAVFRDGDGVRIVDWKTGAFLGDAKSQLGFYAMAWRQSHGSLPVALEALSLKTGESWVTHPTQDDVAETESEVADMIAALRRAMEDRSELARDAGPHCQWCPLLDNCDEGGTALRILR